MEQQKNKKKLNIAILSPNEDVYSETFIQAHKNNIDGNIFYYYDGYTPTKLEGFGELKFENVGEDLYDLSVQDENYKKLYNLHESLKNNNIDVVIAEYGITAAESLIAIKSLGIPLITHFHGFDASVKDLVNKYKWQYNKVFEYSEKVIVVSKKMEEMIIKLGCPKQKIVYAPCGPDKDFFEVRPVFKSKQFLAVGRFVNKKAPYYTILAFKKVVEKYPDAKLKMLADGPYFDICKNIVKNCKIEDNVIFAGSVDHDTVMKEMKDSIAFVQHSITADNGDMEGTPVAVMEAGAASLPVISTRHAGIPDVVIDNKTGFLVDEHDVCGMTKSMMDVLDDIDRARQMGQNAHLRIRNDFSLEKSINKINETLVSCSRKKTNINLFLNMIKSNPQYQLRFKNEQIKQKKQMIIDLRNSKSFQIGQLFFRSVTHPYKLITFPVNFIKLLLK